MDFIKNWNHVNHAGAAHILVSLFRWHHAGQTRCNQTKSIKFSAILVEDQSFWRNTEDQRFAYVWQ